MCTPEEVLILKDPVKKSKKKSNGSVIEFNIIIMNIMIIIKDYHTCRVSCALSIV